jgi:hypothetical protein
MWARQEEPRTCQEQEEPRTCQEARWVRALGAAHTAGGAVCLPGDAKSETRQRLRRGGQGSAGGSSGGAAAHNTSRTTRTGRTRHGIIHRHRHQHTVMGSAFFHAMPDLGVKLTDDKFPAMTIIGEELTYEEFYRMTNIGRIHTMMNIGSDPGSSPMRRNSEKLINEKCRGKNREEDADDDGQTNYEEARLDDRPAGASGGGRLSWPRRR